MKRKFYVVLGWALLSGGMLTCPANADWQFLRIEYDSGSGTETQEDAWAPYPGTHSGTPANKVLWGTGGSGSGSINPRGSAGYTHAKGKVRSVFQYVPRQIGGVPDPTDTVPEFLTLKISASASALAQDQDPNRVPHPGATDPYFGVAVPYTHTSGNEHVLVSVRGKSAPVIVGPYNTTAQIQIKDLVKIRTEGQNEVAGPWCDIEAKGSIDGDRFDLPWPNVYSYYKIAVEGTTAASASYSAVHDNRSVSLSRVGAVGDYVDSDGVTHGDTLYSWMRQYPNDLAPNRNFQSFTASYGGDWDNPTWNWAPGGSFLTKAASPSDPSHTSYDKYSGNWIMEFGTAGETVPILGSAFWDANTDAPKEVTLKYFARDTDDAEVQATYKLKLHNPVEEINKTNTPMQIEAPLWGSDPTTNDNTLFIADGPLSPGDRSVSKGSASTSGWTLGSSLSGDITVFSLPLKLAVTGSYAWSKTENLNSTSSLDKAVLAGQSVYPVVIAKYNRIRTYFYKYNAAGRERRILQLTAGPTEFPHEAVQDVYAGSDIGWKILGPGSPYPVFNPNAPIPTLPDPSVNAV